MYIKNEINIFIVEDNKIFMLALKADIESAFIDMPICINIFENGEECIQNFKEINPQVVIIDYHLNAKNPKAANGIAVLDWIKKENPETKILILTGDDNIDIALNSFKHGASDYIVKTDTQFRKVIYSLFNLFKLIKAKNDVKKYKTLAIGLFVCLVLLIVGLKVLDI